MDISGVCILYQTIYRSMDISRVYVFFTELYTDPWIYQGYVFFTKQYTDPWIRGPDPAPIVPNCPPLILLPCTSLQFIVLSASRRDKK